MFRRYQRIHWSTFNIVGRLFGIMAAIAAVAFGAWGVYFVFRPEAGSAIDTGGIAARALYLLLGAFCAGLSLLFLFVRPYRPDLQDRAWTRQADKLPEPSERRSWWTGRAK